MSERTCRALVLEQPGDPSRAVRLRDVPIANPGPGEVRVRMLASPINPADINVLEGRYVRAPGPDGIPGNEGVGVVERVGLTSRELKVGQTVIFPARMGAWCEQRILPSDQVLGLPPGLPVDQAAMLGVNPPTAWRLLRDFVDLHPGDWVVQNAANSALGQCVIQLARSLKLRTLNLVRRSECVEHLKRLGADAVVVDGPDLLDEVRSQTGGIRARLGINLTSGPLLQSMVRCLDQQATLVTVGAMSREPFSISNGALIFKEVTVRGFWVTGWLESANPARVRTMYDDLVQELREGRLQQPVDQRFPLDDYEAAMTRATQPGRGGKVLLRIG